MRTLVVRVKPCPRSPGNSPCPGERRGSRPAHERHRYRCVIRFSFVAGFRPARNFQKSGGRFAISSKVPVQRVCRREVLTIGLKNGREINTAVPPYYLGTAARGLVLAIRRRKSGKRHAEAEHCRESLMHRQWQHGGGIVLRDCAWRR